MRRATTISPFQSRTMRVFQSTLSMRRATDTWDGAETFDRISIHALHEESDEGSRPAGLVAGISIHALHEESDQSMVSQTCTKLKFQSTLSMRRATTLFHADFRPSRFQSTLSMRRATRHCMRWRPCRLFQSTLSMRRATVTSSCGCRCSPHFNPRSP